MTIEIITKEDLEKFKQELFEEMRKTNTSQSGGLNKLLKASDVRKMLGISMGTLQNLRINGTLPYSKVGGTTYYLYDDILKLIEKTKRNGEK